MKVDWKRLRSMSLEDFKGGCVSDHGTGDGCNYHPLYADDDLIIEDLDEDVIAVLVEHFRNKLCSFPAAPAAAAAGAQEGKPVRAEWYGMTDYRDFFRASARQLEADIHENAVDHGWWEGERNSGECIALMHSELSEALEAFREGNPQSEKPLSLGDRNASCVEEELADVIIRILDFSGATGLRVVETIIAKHGYNKGRPYKHGGKAF